MLTMEIILCLAAVGNVAWSIHNFRVHQGVLKAQRAIMLSAESAMSEANMHLRNARLVVQAAKLEQEYKACPICQRITTQHITHDDGVTRCVNCHADMLNGYAVGQKINA